MGAEQAEWVIRHDVEALQHMAAGSVTTLTEAATGATFYREGLTPGEIGANRRIVAISEDSVTAAATNDHQHLAAAFAGSELAGYVIATRHAADDLELDWLMVHPQHHGSGVAAALMKAGMAWLGWNRPMWLTVIRHNERAIRFYRRFGFEIDQHTATSHVVPHWIMRRSSHENAGPNVASSPCEMLAVP